MPERPGQPVECAERLRRLTGRELPLDILFDRPVLADLVAAIRDAEARENESHA